MCSSDLGLCVGLRIPGTCLVGVAGHIADCGDIIFIQLESVALQTVQRHGNVLGLAVIPGTVHYLEYYFLLDLFLLCVGVSVDRITCDLGLGIGFNIP